MIHHSNKSVPVLVKKIWKSVVNIRMKTMGLSPLASVLIEMRDIKNTTAATANKSRNDRPLDATNTATIRENVIIIFALASILCIGEVPGKY
jgi:hypothetical protein